MTHIFQGEFLSRFILILCLSLLYSHLTLADRYFDNLNDDQTVPTKCRDTSLKHFLGDETVEIEYFTTSIRGSVERGFTYEYPISRHGASLIWRALKNPRELPVLEQEYANEPSLERDYERLKKHGPMMGFDFNNEGEVLEALGLLFMKNHYDNTIYYFTGGVAYHNPFNFQGGYLGELDFIVGLRETCQVVAVGEAKLGAHRLGKAKSQLARFRNFLNSHR